MPWSLVFTDANAEFSVERELTLAKISNHLFKRSTRVLLARTEQFYRKFIAAWPRYIFANVRTSSHPPLILGVRGVRDFVKFEDRIPIVPDVVIRDLVGKSNHLRDRYGDLVKDVLPDEERPCDFQFGETVVVIGAGVVHDYEAVFQYPIDDGKVVVLQEWLGRLVPITLKESDIDHKRASLARNDVAHRVERRKYRNRRKMKR
jgi:transcription antitermination factor NusG